MKKIFYLLIACTMMCFAGCEEKGDEIDNTTDTGENVEINEANLVGTWKIESIVEKWYEEEDEGDDLLEYVLRYNSNKGKWEEYESYKDEVDEPSYFDMYSLSLTLNKDKTYKGTLLEQNYSYIDEDGKDVYDKYEDRIEENGTWSLSKDADFSLRVVTYYRKYTDEKGTGEASFTHDEWLANTYKGGVHPDGLFRDGGSSGLYEDFLKEDREGITVYYTCSIKELTSTSLVIERKVSDKSLEDIKKLRGDFSEVYTFKKVK